MWFEIIMCDFYLLYLCFGIYIIKNTISEIIYQNLSKYILILFKYLIFFNGSNKNCKINNIIPNIRIYNNLRNTIGVKHMKYKINTNF